MKSKVSKKRVVIGSALLAIGLLFLAVGILELFNGYAWLKPLPPKLIFGIGDIIIAFYVLKGGNWKDFFQVIRF